VKCTVRSPKANRRVSLQGSAIAGVTFFELKAHFPSVFVEHGQHDKAGQGFLPASL
jgi:hypothetical protein